jgi:hypothetical protein
VKLKEHNTKRIYSNNINILGTPRQDSAGWRISPEATGKNP